MEKISPGEVAPAGPGALAGLTDAELMDRVAAAADQAAFSILVKRWEAPIMARCRRITQNDTIAQEVTQETFMRIWRSQATWIHNRSFAGWAFQICENSSIDAINALNKDATGHIKAPERDQTGDLQDPLDKIPDRLPVIPAEYRIAIAGCIQKLRFLDRKFLELKFWNGMSVAEIGRNLLNTNDPTEAEYRVHTIKGRAYKDLRKCLERKGKTDVVFPRPDPSSALGGTPEIAGADS